MFLTIEGGKLVAYAEPRIGSPTVITTAAELAAISDPEHGIWTSSAIDFPHEYTSDPNTLALVALLHGSAS